MIDYKVLAAVDISCFNKLVTEYLNKGYILTGSLQIWNGYCYQAVVKLGE